MELIRLRLREAEAPAGDPADGRLAKRRLESKRRRGDTKQGRQSQRHGEGYVIQADAKGGIRDGDDSSSRASSSGSSPGRPIRGQTGPAQAPAADGVRTMGPLFNGRDLTGWYTFLQKHGKNQDPDRVITIEDGAIHLYKDAPEGSHVVMGYIATEKEYGDYHLRLQYRWGGKKFEPRLKLKRDAGLYYHIIGPDAVWPRGLQYQIEQTNVGDLIALHGRPARHLDRPEDPLRARCRPSWRASREARPYVLGGQGDRLPEAPGGRVRARRLEHGGDHRPRRHHDPHPQRPGGEQGDRRPARRSREVRAAPTRHPGPDRAGDRGGRALFPQRRAAAAGGSARRGPVNGRTDAIPVGGAYSMRARRTAPSLSLGFPARR